MARSLTADEKRALPYRPCAGTIVVNGEGLVGIGRRLPNEEYVGQTRLWQFPQGGIDPDEDVYAAALRELYEETSIRSVSPIADVPGWLTYDLPEHLIGVALKGRYRGQKQRWFVLRFEGREDEVNVLAPPDGHKPEFDAWEWVPIESVPERAVPFKVPLYQSIIASLRGRPELVWLT